ncbi:hypothetical protein HHL11_23655 [Ramlibacter sp. G-1-2-2]|uniref:Uncharacterized protein n=1 Tax=Ramlibacter agri TaxID=2728837 RepID=A0A848HB90_9BURK|nr:nitrate reductase associated protein [Ramlibacter agri]NML46760.1 hypothetical protein [Ramlibacter agri]
MQFDLSPDLSPTACLDVDSASARDLAWLPYAVRFKLDECGLTLSLRDWQQLALAERAALVRTPLVPGTTGFEQLARACGAGDDAGGQRTDGNVEGVASQDWLARSTPFARYVLRKLVHKKLAHQQAA